MALDRWIAFVILLVCLLYGYAAFFTMDDLLPPIMRRSPIWPSSFPKVLVIGATIMALAILFRLEKSNATESQSEISFARLLEYNYGQAALLLGLMVAYALLLRPLGFLPSTFLFLTVGAYILGERRYLMMSLIAAIASGGIWYLVEQILGIFLSPWPSFLAGA